MEYYWFIGISAWIVSILVCIALAQKKGYGAVLGALIGTVLSLVGVIVLGLMPYKRGFEESKRREALQEKPPLTSKELGMVVMKGIVGAAIAAVVAIALIWLFVSFY